jgi:hypothetical protein
VHTAERGFADNAAIADRSRPSGVNVEETAEFVNTSAHIERVEALSVEVLLAILDS